MHHHQDESGMNEETGKERDGVARRHGVTEIMKLAGNVAEIIPVIKKRSRCQGCMIFTSFDPEIS